MEDYGVRVTEDVSGSMNATQQTHVIKKLKNLTTRLKL
jgi:hypothetical protein